MAKKKPRLGRGLNSLMAANPVPVNPPAEEDQAPADSDQPTPAKAAQPETDAGTSGTAAADPTTAQPPEGLVWVETDQIRPNPYQPRKTINDNSLHELAASIRQDGIMQPVVVRAGREGGYQLVAGERRWRAAQQAGLERVPALVRDLDERQMAEWALIENLQRENLNPVERAEALRTLADRFSLTHQVLADRIGADRASVTNALRLLELDEEVRELVRCGKLSAGHGRSLLGIDDPEGQRKLARQAAGGGWSVRRIEQAVRQANQPIERSGKKKTAGARSAHLRELEQRIAQQLGTKVQIKPGRKKNAGTLMIDFYDLDQFDLLMSKLGVDVE